MYMLHQIMKKKGTPVMKDPLRNEKAKKVNADEIWSIHT